MNEKLFVLRTLFLIIFLPFSLFSQEGRGNGRVVGYVVDENGAPLSGVKVVMESTSYNFMLETVSDEKGRWIFMGFAKDTYKFTFLKEGYISVLSQIFLSGLNRNPEQKIIMKRKEAESSTSISPELRKKLENAMESIKAERFQEAISLLEQFLESYPSMYLARYQLGNAYLKIQNFDSAIAQFKRVLEEIQKEKESPKLKEKKVEIFISMAEAFIGKGNLDEAAFYYKMAFENSKSPDPALAYNIAEIMFNIGNVDEAIKFYELAITLDPKCGAYYLKLGYTHLNKGNISNSIKCFEKFIELSPDDPQVEAIRNLVNILKR